MVSFVFNSFRSYIGEPTNLALSRFDIDENKFYVQARLDDNLILCFVRNVIFALYDRHEKLTIIKTPCKVRWESDATTIERTAERRSVGSDKGFKARPSIGRRIVIAQPPADFA